MSKRGDFWSKVLVGEPDACWQWTGAKTSTGYGSVWWRGRTMRAHRVAWLLVNGPIPHGAGYHGTCVLHRCDNRLCCNLAHLFLGTNRENALDMIGKGRFTPMRGETNGRAKLTISNVQEIRRLRAAGESQRGLGRRFSVSDMTIRRIIAGRRWSSPEVAALRARAIIGT